MCLYLWQAAKVANKKLEEQVEVFGEDENPVGPEADPEGNDALPGENDSVPVTA